MTAPRTRPILHAPLLALPVAVVLGACAPMPTKTTLLASSLDLTVPTGPVHLPSIKDGYGVQGFVTLSANQHRWRKLGRPDEDFDLGAGYDTAVIEGPIFARLPVMVASGEASLLIGGLFRMSVGADFTQRETAWFGMGFFSTGKNWHTDLGAAIGKIGLRRHEVWRQETIDEQCDQDSCDWKTNTEDIVVVSTGGSPMFWKVGIDVAHVKTGILAGYQLIDLPVTESPNGNGFSLLTHTFTLGCFKPTRLGTFSLFAQTTNLGETWSPSAKLQYSVIIGGEKSPDSERTK